MSKPQVNCIYHFSFTYNKHDTKLEVDFVKEHEDISKYLITHFENSKFIFQLERGEDTLRLHYQGWLHVKVKTRPIALAAILRKQMPGVHVTANSNAGLAKAEFYCNKNDKTKVAGPWCDPSYLLPDYSDLLEPTGWQVPIKEMLLGPPIQRKIYWIWEETGCTGKSMFTTYMEVHHNIIGLGLGTANDNFYAVSEIQAKGYIFDVPRTVPQRFDWGEVYMSIEKIKDRNFLSTKYKPKKVILPIIPHVVVFANKAPNKNSLSHDRWVVQKIVNGNLVKDKDF